MKRTARGGHVGRPRIMRKAGRSGRFGAVMAAAAVVALAGGLSACGGNDSTVSSTPSAAATTSSDAGSSGTAETSKSQIDPKPSGAPQTAPPETPQALPSDYPGPTAAELSQSDHRFLDTLRSQDVAFAGNSDSAVSTGNYVCAAGADQVPADQIHATVLASIALDAQNRGDQADVEKQTDTFISTAQDTLCK